MNEKEKTNGISNFHANPDWSSESAVQSLKGSIAAKCENLGADLREFVTSIEHIYQVLNHYRKEVEEMHHYQNNLSKELSELRIKLQSYESFKGGSK